MEQKIWWYSLSNEQKGPVTQDELTLLSNQNFISQNTPVWKEGLTNWINFSDINAPVDSSPQRPPLPPGFSQPNMNTAQPAVGNPPQNPGLSQPKAGYNQPNNPQPNANGQSHIEMPNPMSFVTDIYYRTEFEKIITSNESYKGKWNWWAFFFSWVWGFTKGLWLYSVIVLVITFALPYFIPFMISNLFALAVAIFYGSRGTFMYYNVKMKNKQIG